MSAPVTSNRQPGMSQSPGHMMCVNGSVEKISIPSCWIESSKYFTSQTLLIVAKIILKETATCFWGCLLLYFLSLTMIELIVSQWKGELMMDGVS